MLDGELCKKAQSEDHILKDISTRLPDSAAGQCGKNMHSDMFRTHLQSTYTEPLLANINIVAYHSPAANLQLEGTQSVTMGLQCCRRRRHRSSASTGLAAKALNSAKVHRKTTLSLSESFLKEMMQACLNSIRALVSSCLSYNFVEHADGCLRAPTQGQ